MKHTVNGEVYQNKPISASIYDMWIYAPDLFVEQAELLKAGQFMMLYADGDGRLLPRPISLCEAQPETQRIRLVYQVAGQGTAYFASLATGATVRLFGPQGNGFNLSTTPYPIGKHIVVGGGVGTPPLLMLSKTLRKKNIPITAVLGFKDEPILTEDFVQYCDEVQIATDSGRSGFHGNAVTLLKQMPSDIAQIYACGPRPMLKALVEWAVERRIPVQVSMEERMACGIGACVGCAVAVKQDATGTVYKRVCKDGPVFDGRQVIL